MKFNVPDHEDKDGGDLKIKPLKCFVDDMTENMEETKENLLKMKEIHEGFRDLSGLEINEGKAKLILIGANQDDLTPKKDEVKFKYVTSIQLLGVNIDNKLCILEENFELRKKIAIWSKLNLSNIRNLIIFLGYLLSLMES